MRVLLHLLFSIIAIQIMAKKTIKVDEHKVCGKGENCPLKIHNLDLQYTREGGFSFSGKVEFYRDAQNDKLKVVFDFQRCASREALDSCEKLSSLKPPSFCRLMELRGFGLDELRNGFEPPFHCPFKKGIYKIKNATVNPELFHLLPLEGYYWKLNTSVFEDKSYVGSICFDFMIINMRN